MRHKLCTRNANILWSIGHSSSYWALPGLIDVNNSELKCSNGLYQSQMVLTLYNRGCVVDIRRKKLFIVRQYFSTHQNYSFYSLWFLWQQFKKLVPCLVWRVLYWNCNLISFSATISELLMIAKRALFSIIPQIPIYHCQSYGFITLLLCLMKLYSFIIINQNCSGVTKKISKLLSGKLVEE